MTPGGKTVIVIGRTSSFGKATALKAAELRTKLTITGRNAVKLDQAVSESAANGHNLAGQMVNAVDVASIPSFFAGIEDFDHLVLMAGAS